MKIRNIILGLFSVIFVCFIGIMVVRADDPNVAVVEDDNASISVLDNTANDNKRDIMLNVNNVKSGKRLDKILYCINTNDCNNETNWIDVTTFDERNKVSPYQIGVGSNDMSFGLVVPADKLKIKVQYADFEPMNITYSKFKLSTNNENELRNVYIDGSKDLNNYESTFKDLVTGYKGGDIILPNDCTQNGCILKVSFDETDYNNIVDRLNYFNTYINTEFEKYGFLELGAMNNHLDRDNYPGDTIYPYEKNNSLFIETSGNTKSFYLIINKFFNDHNRSDFIVGENRNRILSEDYIGLKYVVDRKYFDEADGFLTFNELNNYTQNATLFYGTPKVKLVVDSVNDVSLTGTGNSDGMGTIKNSYNKIVSKDNTNYPIDNNFELTIKSFYNPEYKVPIILKNGDTTVKETTLTLSRFAFGGNGGSLLVVDGNGKNCRRQEDHPDCREGNLYVSTSYRGLIDTFYTDGTKSTINSFEISKQNNEIFGRKLNNEEVYNRNESFNPWAVAIFYSGERVVTTRSFNLGELVKIEGFTNDVIENSAVNGIAKDNNEIINDYNSADYNVFGYGVGYEKPIGSIKYFSEGAYSGGNIDYTLILASKEELIDNDITRISLFLTNGELKSDEENFPELTYGVGEGKAFIVDERTFDRIGGNE